MVLVVLSHAILVHSEKSLIKSHIERHIDASGFNLTKRKKQMRKTMLLTALFAIGCGGYTPPERTTRNNDNSRGTTSSTHTVQKQAASRQSPTQEPMKNKTAQQKGSKIARPAPPKPAVQVNPVVRLSDWVKQQDTKGTYLCANATTDIDTTIVLTLDFTQDNKPLFTKTVHVKLPKNQTTLVKIPYDEPVGRYNMQSKMEILMKPETPAVADKNGARGQ